MRYSTRLFDRLRREPRGGAFAALAAATTAATLTACGSAQTAGPSPRPVPTGAGPAYRPPSLNPAAAAGRPIGRWRCTHGDAARFGVELELFADRRLILIPPGVGVAPPRREQGAYVSGGRCSYPLRTRAPTGVIEVALGTRATVGDFFAVWGQPLSARRLGAFGGAPVETFVNGRRIDGDPRAIPIRRHDQVTLEIDGFVPPHPAYRFPPGL